MGKCWAPANWEEYVRRWLDKSDTEVAEFVLDEAKETWDGDIGKAVNDALEHYSEWDLEELRRVLDLFEPWCEWREKWEPKGWQIDVRGDVIMLTSPPRYAWGNEDCPSRDAIAAAAGVTDVKLANVSLPTEEERVAGARTEVIFYPKMES